MGDKKATIQYFVIVNIFWKLNIKYRKSMDTLPPLEENFLSKWKMRAIPKVYCLLHSEGVLYLSDGESTIIPSNFAICYLHSKLPLLHRNLREIILVKYFI